MPTPIPAMQTPTPPTPAPRIISGGEGAATALVQMPIEALQAQAAALVRELAGLEVQSRYLRHQTDDDGLSQAQRAQVDGNRANIDVQIAQARADLANVRGQIAARENVSLSRVAENGQVVIVSPPRARPPFDPDVVMGLSFTLLMAIVLPMSIAYARRIWRGKPQPAAVRVDEIAPRLERLEQAVDAIAIEIERVSEGQRFVTKVLAERPLGMAATSPAAPVADSAIDGRPILALGVGAAEPIRKAERQAVRQQMHTPH